MKVYVVTSGEYSSYMINAVCLDKKEAKKLAEFYNGEVETYDTEDNSDKVKDQYFYMITINERISYSGHCEWYFDTRCIDDCLDYYKKQPLNKIIKNVESLGIRKYEAYYYFCYAKDSKHAEKIAQDAFAKYRAEQEGLT